LAGVDRPPHGWRVPSEPDGIGQEADLVGIAGAREQDQLIAAGVGELGQPVADLAGRGQRTGGDLLGDGPVKA